MAKVDVYSTGMVCCSICADKDLTRAEVEAEVNHLTPTGLDHGWTISDDPTFQDGAPNPHPCEKMPFTKLHYLLNC